MPSPLSSLISRSFSLSCSHIASLAIISHLTLPRPLQLARSHTRPGHQARAVRREGAREVAPFAQRAGERVPQIHRVPVEQVDGIVAAEDGDALAAER
jgi:hypothetical protein